MTLQEENYANLGVLAPAFVKLRSRDRGAHTRAHTHTKKKMRKYDEKWTDKDDVGSALYKARHPPD